jgi:hypothetical protein
MKPKKHDEKQVMGLSAIHVTLTTQSLISEGRQDCL